MSDSDNALIEAKDLSLSFPLYLDNDPNAKSKFIEIFNFNKPKIEKVKSIHAINKINFKIEAKSCVGIIGHNGAGKSSLIRLISNIYTPTKGNILVKGKVTTLMDFGIGFNAHLDAIENIKIASLIMGIPKEHIKERTQEILEFSELKEFSNLPLKYYSKGMRSRLGFCTATDIAPEILLLDEVFSGGDIHWVKKSLKRLEAVIEKAKIVVIISHNLNTIEKYCSRSIWLKKGEVLMDGSSVDIIKEYRGQS